MTPLVVNLENAMEIIPDWRRRLIGDEARKYANEGLQPKVFGFGQSETYWGSVVLAHEELFWRDAYAKRRARLQRLAVSPPPQEMNSRGGP